MSVESVGQLNTIRFAVEERRGERKKGPYAEAR